MGAHGCDHNVVDPYTGDFYFRYFRNFGADYQPEAEQIWKLQPDGTFAVRTTFPHTQYVAVALGTTWWTGLAGKLHPYSFIVASRANPRLFFTPTECPTATVVPEKPIAVETVEVSGVGCSGHI
jgi:hypothetical protein